MQGTDPVGAGFVASLARPAGNITGFTYAEPEMASKWPELLNAIAPAVKLLRPRRVHAVRSNPPHFPLDTDRALSVRQYPSYLRSLVEAGNQATARGRRAPDRILFC